MRFKRLDEFGSVVVVNPDEHIVRAAHDPLLANDPLCGAHRKFGYFERLHQRVCGMVPYIHVATIQVGKDPRLGGVQLDSFHPVGSLDELALDIKTKWHRVKHGRRE